MVICSNLSFVITEIVLRLYKKSFHNSVTRFSLLFGFGRLLGNHNLLFMVQNRSLFVSVSLSGSLQLLKGLPCSPTAVNNGILFNRNIRKNVIISNQFHCFSTAYFKRNRTGTLASRL
jgi:hypothetical protein